MIAKILAPLDGTKIAEAGLTWAEHAAARCGAGIRLLTVVEQARGASNGRQGTAAVGAAAIVRLGGAGVNGEC